MKLHIGYVILQLLLNKPAGILVCETRNTALRGCVSVGAAEWIAEYLLPPVKAS